MESTAKGFNENVRQALGDANLRDALSKLADGFPAKRREAAGRLPEFEALRDQARDIKHHVLSNLDFYLEAFEARVTESGGTVHWCRTAAEARTTILKICKQAGAKTVTKSKSMIGEEIAINEHLEEHGIEPVETDLGEYIIQLRHEPPSHIIAPAIHLTKEQVADTFREKHTDLLADRNLDEPRALLEEARGKLRQKFVRADVGLTGANMLIAETGSIALVTNEGNADLTYSIPNVHIAIASIEKIVPTLEDATTVLRVLARSATGQDISVYTTFCTGPKRPGDLDGPQEFHVVLLDNDRTQMLGTEFHDMLRCIRCGACLNHCPVYKAIGGHAYGWVYSGPMGAVLIPNLIGIDEAGDLPNASTLCGKCEDVCPVRIPLPAMLRSLRKRQFERDQAPSVGRTALRAWAFLARRPWLYRLVMNAGVGALKAFSRGRGRFRWLPLASNWTRLRDLPAPEGGTFVSRWNKTP
ncbi:MAG: iron-sulfur cluster-binding protein [Rhodospirillales bacterium]|nr:iron-sulfur cluster-binding protein [Rhodospirillales bacterium]